MRSKIKELQELSKVSFSVECNDHKLLYQDIESALSDLMEDNDIEEEELNEMMRTGNICVLHIYPTTPIGFMTFISSDIDKCVDMALEYLKETKA